MILTYTERAMQSCINLGLRESIYVRFCNEKKKLVVGLESIDKRKDGIRMGRLIRLTKRIRITPSSAAPPVATLCYDKRAIKLQN